VTKLCWRQAYGERAIEILGLPKWRYIRLLETGVNTLDDFAKLDWAKVYQTCSSRVDLLDFQKELRARGFDWDPHGAFDTSLR
jgi:predicted RecB family nuclease